MQHPQQQSHQPRDNRNRDALAEAEILGGVFTEPILPDSARKHHGSRKPRPIELMFCYR